MENEKNGTLHILVVDDETSICDILSQYIGRLGYHVSASKSGAAAMEIVQNATVDLVLTDIKMPGMSGVELLKWVKDFDKSMPVLLTTGFPTLDTAIEALKLGAYDYLTKPFHLEEIGEKIKRALANKKLEQNNLIFSKLVKLHEATKALSSTRERDAIFQKYLDYCARHVEADGGGLMMITTDDAIEFAAGSSPAYDGDFFSQPVYDQADQWVREHNQVLLLPGNGSHPSGGVESVLPDSLSSCIAFPVHVSGKIVAVLNLFRTSGSDPFADVDLEILNVLSSQATVALENAQLLQNLRDNHLKTIRALALAVEAKDRYTHGHSENVMKYTVQLARHLNLPEEDVEKIKYAGLLHDVGKIGISEAILNKPGRLSDVEFEEIKRHPELGARIIEDVPFLKALVPLVLYHHEYYNGNGYPEGIAESNIPLGARILGICDAFEAMTSDRPYRKALSMDVACDILEKNKGIQFDPDLVDAFLVMIHAHALQLSGDENT